MEENWGTSFILGLIEILTGLWLISAPGVASIVLTQILGIFWLVLGAVNAIEAISGQTGRSRLWLLASGVLGLIAGLFIVSNPLLGTLATLTGLTVTIALIGIAMGVVNIIRAFQGGGIGAFIEGALVSLLGILLLLNPISTVINLPMLLGILAIAAGVATTGYALRTRSQRRMETYTVETTDMAGAKGGEIEEKEEPKKKENKKKKE